MIENNPLKQYFRRPSIYFKLPSDGKYYQPGVVDFPENRELPVFPMTAIDEMTVRTPDGLFNGTAIVELIKSCVPNIKDPWKINNIDLDAILVAIKAASGNGKMAIETTCPSCSETANYDVNLFPLLGGIKNVDYNSTLQINELKIKFRPLNYQETNQNGLDQLEIQKVLVSLDQYEDTEEKAKIMNESVKKLNEMIVKIICNTIEYIETPETKVHEQEYIRDFLNNCDKNTSNTIKDYSISLREKSELPSLPMKCPSCGHDYEQKIILNVTDFFD